MDNLLEREKNSEIAHINYLKDRYGSNQLLDNYKTITTVNLDRGKKHKLPNFKKYEIIYYADSSLDQCVTRTRPVSYLNLNHSNKILIKDMCHQTKPFKSNVVFKSLEDKKI